MAANPSGFDTKLVKDLAKILRDTDLNEIEVEHDGTRVRVARTAAVQTVMATVPPPAAAAPAPVPASSPAAPPAAASPSAEAPSDIARHPGAVTSPMVGTIYLQPEPGAAAFVKVGDTVREGQQLFIIEAMKTMNPVPAPRAGVVSAILIVDSQPVEFGEALCVID